MNPRSLHVARAVCAAIVAASLIALATFAILHATVTRTSTVTRGAAPAAKPGSSTPPLAYGSSPTPSEPLLATGSAPVPQLATSPAQMVPATSPAAAAPGESPAPAPAATATVCPLGLPAPTQTGGLASLIWLAPAFGPFTPEAFAMAPAYQPVIQLFGPFVAEFATSVAGAQPTFTTLFTELASLENAGFNVFAPLYGPQRQQVLTYESQIATTLAPYATSLTNSAAGACLVDLEGMLVSAAQP